MWADGGQRGSGIYEGGGGGSAEGPEQSSPEEAQDPGQASSVLQMAPSGFYPRPFWDGSHVHRTEPGLQALETGHAVTTPHLCHEQSPLCPCSGLRAWYLLQRRVWPVRAVHTGDLPGRGWPAQLHTVPQQRRARPGRCPQRIGMRRQVWAQPGGAAGRGHGASGLHRGPQSPGPEPRGAS